MRAVADVLLVLLLAVVMFVTGVVVGAANPTARFTVACTKLSGPRWAGQCFGLARWYNEHFPEQTP